MRRGTIGNAVLRQFPRKRLREANLRVISSSDNSSGSRVSASEMCRYIAEMACELRQLAASAGFEELSFGLHCIAVEAALEEQHCKQY
jgi:hypothetical protein